MAKKRDKFFERIKKDVLEIDHGKLKHHHKIREKTPKHHKMPKIKTHQIRHMVKHKKTKESKPEYSSGASANTERVLAENLVALQKIMTNLALSIDSLSKRISKLLELFEISAKTLAEKDYGLEKSVGLEKELSQKMDKLIEHNKIFARGLALLHENPKTEEFNQMPPAPSPPGFSPQRIVNTDNYQKSISSKP